MRDIIKKLSEAHSLTLEEYRLLVEGYSEENAKVTISAKIAENGKAVHVFFEDNGSGISEETRQHLFSSFAPKGDGLGIGLSLSKDLARAQGGDLILQKTDASGTVFLLTLKRVAPKSKPERF